MLHSGTKNIKIRKAAVFAVIVMLVMTGTSCKREQVENKKELIVYCGITMIRPMTEIAKIIEKQEDCRIIITKGGSGNLLRSIVYNKAGDLYLPGSDKYYEIIDDNYPGLIKDTVLVGHNKAVLMVGKGNPEGISSDLKNLASPEYGVVIGNPESGSIGIETRKILVKKGIYEDVVRNVMHFTTDSKDLTKAIINKEADVVVNWYAVSTWDENPQYIDVVDIGNEYAEIKNLVIGLLTYSKHPEIAKKIMDYAASEKGKALFKKYGLYFEESEL